MSAVAKPLRLEAVSGTFVALVYLILGLADMGFSLLAFRLGVMEGNPVLAWAVARGLFLPAKLSLTVLATVLIAALYGRPRARSVCWGAVGLMVLVDTYHVIALTVHLQGVQ